MTAGAAGSEDGRMRQTIPSGAWTRLDGYDAEVFQRSGAAVSVEVVDGELSPDPAAALWLRPPGGVWPKGYRAPIAGTWVFGDRAVDAGSPITMDTVTVVTFDIEDMTTVDWRP